MKTRLLFSCLLAFLYVSCTGSPTPPVKDAPAHTVVPGVSSPVQPGKTTRPDQKDGEGKTSVGQRVEPVAPFVPAAPGKRVARVSVPGNYVALTFDDGPSASLTPRVLDILNEYGARATFFVLGENAVRNKSLLSRAAAEGHELGSHTWSHIKLTGSSQEKICSEIERTNAVIAEATGKRPLVMRPPYGATNAGIVNLMDSRFGMSSILWDVDTRDWQHPGVDVVVRRAVGNARPGSIILVHDIHASTLAAVEGIVSGLQARGFKLVTVSQLMELGRRAAGQGAAPLAPAAAPPVPAPAVVAGGGAAAALSLNPAEKKAPVVTLPPAEGSGSTSIGTLPPAPLAPEGSEGAQGGSSISGAR